MKKLILIFILGVIISNTGKTQGNDCVNSNMLAWFKTKNKNWIDKGNDYLTLYYMDDCNNYSPFSGNKMYSVNFNPALLFDSNSSENMPKFVLKDNRSTNITIIGVLIPHDRQNYAYQWGLSLPYLGEIRTLDKDYMDIITPMLPTTKLDYGPPASFGSNLLNSDDDKFGKIVTYQTILRPDRTLSASRIVGEIISLYYNNINKGHVPEFIVYDGMLEEDERLNVETYLAVKYGISKELDYLSCNYDKVWDSQEGEEYNQRKAGISNDAGWVINQSRSTSYYDDDVYGDTNASSGRFEDYNTVQDYSHHKNRLLTIGIEDESSNIKVRWKEPSYNIWGSNNKSVIKDGGEDLITINRVWRMESHDAGDDIIPEIQWCNYLNLKNINGFFEKKYADQELTGIAASSLGLETCKKGYFIFSAGGDGQGSIVGFSSDNMEFVKLDNPLNPNPPGLPEYKGYIYAVKFDGGSASVVWDEDGDGYYDHETGIGQSGGTYKLNFERSDEGNYIFNVNGQFPFYSTHACHGKGGVYAKMHIKSNYFGVQVIGGKGFVKGKQKGTNVEFSYERIKNEVFNGKDMIEQGLVPVLLINRESSGEFDAGSAERIRGDYSTTPLTYGDKVEFVDVKWSNNSSDLFTLGFVPKCDEEKTVEINVDECCDIMNVSFRATSCSNSEPIFYQLYDSDGNIILYGCGYTDEDIELGELPEGDYQLVVYFKDCSTITKDFTLELTQSLPDNLIAEEVVELMNGEVLLEINTDFFPPDFDFYNENIEIIWTTPSGEVFTFPSPDGLTFLATEIGTYTVEFKVTCNDELSCSVFDSVLVVEPCEYEVETETSQCCYCNYLIVNITSEKCPEDSWQGAEITIYDDAGNLLCSMELTEMKTEIPLCEVTGDISYEINFANGTTITGEETLDEFLWQEMDLIEQEDGVCDTIKNGGEICYDITHKMQELGTGWQPPKWKKIDPLPEKDYEPGTVMCTKEPGTYTVNTHRRCSGGIMKCDGEASDDNGCQVNDTFCIVKEITEDPCEDIIIDIGCDDYKSLGGYGDYSGIPVCIYNVPEGCYPTKWRLEDEYGTYIAGGGNFFFDNGVWYTYIDEKLPPGNYIFTVFFGGRCPCGKKSTTFTVSKKGKGKNLFVRNSYCINENNNIIIDTIPENEDDICVRWEKEISDTVFTVVKEGLFASNATYTATSPGKYLVQLYNCANDDILDENEFTVLDCSVGLAQRLNVTEIICSDDDKRLELQIPETDSLEDYFDYQIWSLVNGNIDELVYSGRTYRSIPTYVYYLLPDTYLMKVTNEYGYESSMNITISNYKRLPAKILYKQEIELQEEPIEIDASVNVMYEAMYEWNHNGDVISNEALVQISDTGRYSVFVSTDDCQKWDTINVIGQPIEQRASNKQGYIKLEFPVPGFNESLQKIVIVNKERQASVKFEVYSITGQLIFSDMFMNTKTNTVSIELKAGAYLLRATNSSGESIVEKMLVQ